ncbi:hypothetical protein LMH87_006852 [Akanthomyces muscarius]|uniref:Uncharacterized protein n=1 Tax=Akanthomyces muscarius TaxID=2231603 RepID=A0A9W8QNL3_AKAMU|nr:hypothetical protein LMH87_006852 [Akanthomyces muscarius]KAJ4165211.1 hypothetical protein LMH87_006852 [Akanthomyces muscarius]
MLAAVQRTMILQSHATAPAYPPSSFLVKMPFHINVKARAGGRQSGVFVTILSSHNIARGTSREYSQLQQVTSPLNAHQCFSMSTVTKVYSEWGIESHQTPCTKCA